MKNLRLRLICVAVSIYVSVCGASEIPISLESNGLASFKISNHSEVKEFIEPNLSSQFRLRYYDAEGEVFVRIVDLGRTVEVDYKFLETYTMTPLNEGDVAPSLGPYLDATLIEYANEGATKLFTYESLFGLSLEKARYEAVCKIADDYLVNKSDQSLTKKAAHIPFKFLSGEKIETDNFGRLPYSVEVNQIIKDYPQSYSQRPELVAHARALSSIKPRVLTEEVFLKKEDFELNGVPVTIINDSGITQEKLSYEQMLKLAIPIVPCRLFPTGNFYSEPELREFVYFRLPGHSIKGFEIKALGELFFEDNPYIVEVVAFNDCTLSIHSEDEPFYLLIPPGGKYPELFLGCAATVDESGHSSFDWMDVLFGIQAINLIQL